MSPRSQPIYLATVLPGLEPVAAAELTAKIADAMLLEIRRGKLLFTTAAPVDDLLDLRSVDNIYVFIDRFGVGPHRSDLPDLKRAVAAAKIRGAVAAAGLDGGGRPSFVLNASRSGKQTYSRFELAAAAAEGIAEVCPRWRNGTPEEHQLEFRLDLADAEALLSLRITPASFRYRGETRGFSQAALRPTVAHALVWLSEPNPDETFLDPFCGSGTILSERAAYPAQRILGGDASAEAVAVARHNLPGATIQVWDACHLPLDAASVDCVVTNLPFGRQILTPDAVGGLYHDFLQELRRVLRPAGRAFMLTDQVDALETAGMATGLRLERLMPLSLKGLHPWIFRMASA